MTEAEKLQALEDAIASPAFSHTRVRSWCRVMLCYVYHRDPDSPTGVKLAAAGEEDQVMAMLRRHGKAAPLSPTEGL